MVLVGPTAGAIRAAAEQAPGYAPGAPAIYEQTDFRAAVEQAASLAVEFVLACIDATERDPQAGWYGVEFEKALPLLCERVRELPEN